MKKVNMRIDSLKNKVDVYANVAAMKGKAVKGPLKDLMHSSAPGKHVTRIGVAMFWIPEPTMISDAVALPMIAAGKLMNRYYTGTTIKHVGEEAAKTLKSLKEFLG